MKKNIPCGRLVMNKAGVVKELKLINGGGPRNCNWDSVDMDFNEIHERLREKYSIDSKQKSFLYDFQITPIDQIQYRTFFDYVNKNGLQFRRTLLFLCTSEVDNNNVFNSIISAQQKTTVVSQTIQNPIQTTNNIPQAEPDSSSSSLIRMSDELQHNQPSINKNHFIENHQTYVTSFQDSLNHLFNYSNNLLTENNHEHIFLDIFTNICAIKGLSSNVLDKSKSHGRQEEISIVILDDIEKSCQSIRTLLESNTIKMIRNNRYLDLFDGFYQNFSILRGRIPSPHQRLINNDSQEKHSLFKPLLKSFDHLSDELRDRNFTSFYYYVQPLVNRIKDFQKVNINDDQSLSDVENMTRSIEKSLTRRMEDEYNRPAFYSRNQRLVHSYEKTLTEIKDLLKSLNNYRLELNQMNRSLTSLWSTPPQPYSQHQPIEHKSNNKLKRKHTRIENNSSSEGSHSSFDDDNLMEVARHALEQHKNR